MTTTPIKSRTRTTVPRSLAAHLKTEEAVIDPDLLALARRERAENPRPPFTAEQERAILTLFGPLQVPPPAMRRAA